MHAKIEILHDRAGGGYAVTVSTPSFEGEVRRYSDSFTYGDDSMYPTAAEALDAAINFADGASMMHRALSGGGVSRALTAEIRQMRKASQIDE